jgi:hypothetical protein
MKDTARARRHTQTSAEHAEEIEQTGQFKSSDDTV